MRILVTLLLASAAVLAADSEIQRALGYYGCDSTTTACMVAGA